MSRKPTRGSKVTTKLIPSLFSQFFYACSCVMEDWPVGYRCIAWLSILVHTYPRRLSSIWFGDKVSFDKPYAHWTRWVLVFESHYGDCLFSKAITENRSSSLTTACLGRNVSSIAMWMYTINWQLHYFAFHIPCTVFTFFSIELVWFIVKSTPG